MRIIPMTAKPEKANAKPTELIRKATSRKEIAAFLRHPDALVRTAFASSPHASEADVAILSKDADPFVRAAVASRRTLDPKRRDRLIKDSHPLTRRACAYALDLSPAQIDVLVADFDIVVKATVALLPSLSEGNVISLAGDASEHVRLSVARRGWDFPLPPKAFPGLLRRAPPEILSTLARRPGLPEDVTIELAEKGNSTTIKNLANNDDAPRAALVAILIRSRKDGRAEAEGRWNALSAHQRLAALDAFSTARPELAEKARKKLVAAAGRRS